MFVQSEKKAKGQPFQEPAALNPGRPFLITLQTFLFRKEKLQKKLSSLGFSLGRILALLTEPPNPASGGDRCGVSAAHFS
jgi:hypothetical protein